MTDNEIIKALEYCSETNGCICCEYVPTEYGKGTVGCATELMKSALDLIKRQQAEIERLKGEQQNYKDFLLPIMEAREDIKAEAIKEFAEKLKEKCATKTRFKNLGFKIEECGVTEKEIDNLIKEMVGDSDARDII